MKPDSPEGKCDLAFWNLQTSIFLKKDNYLAPISLPLSGDFPFSFEPRAAIKAVGAGSAVLPAVTQLGSRERGHTPQDKPLTPECTASRGHPDSGDTSKRTHGLLLGLLCSSLSPGASLKATQVVVQRLDISEDTHGVRLAAHHHHVLHLDEALAVGQVPETQKPHQNDGPCNQPPRRPSSPPGGENSAWSWRLPSAAQQRAQAAPAEPLQSLSLTQCSPHPPHSGSTRATHLDLSRLTLTSRQIKLHIGIPL